MQRALEKLKIKTIATNSAKTAYYAPSLCKAHNTRTDERLFEDSI
jgi:predicted aconitase